MQSKGIHVLPSFSNDLIDSDLNLSNEIWSVFMLGQIGKNSLLDDFRRYFLFSEIYAFKFILVLSDLDGAQTLLH